jgi:PBP1b-binding outer membrane lipoprotein LpoB
MKRIFLIPVLLVGCASSPPPKHSYANTSVPPVQLVLDAKVQQMSRQEVINATQDCESNGMRAAPIMSKRLVSGMMSDIIIDVHCMPRPKFPY